MPDDFLSGLLAGVLLGAVLMGLVLWGLDWLEDRRHRRHRRSDLRYVNPPARRGAHTPPARNPPPP